MKKNMTGYFVVFAVTIVLTILGIIQTVEKAILLTTATGNSIYTTNSTEKNIAIILWFIGFLLIVGSTILLDSRISHWNTHIDVYGKNLKNTQAKNMYKKVQTLRAFFFTGIFFCIISGVVRALK